MSFVEAGFWFLLGFFVASWLAWRAQARQRTKAIKSFQVAKTEVLELLDSLRDVTEVKITIIDHNGELELETEEDPPAALSSRSRKDLH